VVAVVVIAVVVVVALALAGVFSTGSGNGQGTTGTPLYYGQVATEGADGVQNESGGPWSLVAAEGFGLTTSTSGATAAGSLDNGCTANPAPGSPSTATLPATPTGSTPGAEAAWLFLATNPSGEVLLYVVTQSASYPLFLVSGSCTTDFGGLTTIAGLSVVNSTTVAGIANENGGSAFLSSNPGALVILALLGSGLGGSQVPYWAVEYNSCGLSTSGTGTLLIAVYDAEDGSTVSGPTSEATEC
jgi:hypothetical protein